MKRIVLAVAVLAALAAGQYIEKYIPLPDSLGSVYEPVNLAYNPGAGRLYLPGYSRVLTVDALTGERIGSWPTSYNEGPVCYEPTGDAVYFSSYNEADDRYELLVHDGTTGALRARVPTGRQYVVQFSPNPVAGKVLCLLGEESWVGGLLVLSSTGDSVLAYYDEGLESKSAVFSPRMNRHYIADYGRLLVLDGAGDSLLAPIAVRGHPQVVGCNPVNNTVYIGGEDDWLFIASCSLNAVVDSGQVSGVVGLASDSVAGRVYAVAIDRGVMTVFDAGSNRIIDSVSGLYYPRLVWTSPARGKVYVADDDGLHVLDALTLRQVAMLDDAEPIDLVVGQGGTLVYWTDGGRGLVAIDGVGDTLVCSTPLGWRFAPLCYNPANGRVYGYDGSEYGLLSFDAASGDGLIHRPAGYLSAGVCCSLYNKLFVKGYRQVQSYHCAGDTFVPVESIMPSYYGCYYPMWHDSRDHRVFAGDGRDALLVIDCRTDAVVDRVVLGHLPGKMVVDDYRRRLYVSDMTSDANGDSIVTAVDVDGDSVLWRASMSRRLRDLEHNPANNCLYVLGYRTTRDWDMVVLDCSTREVVACFPLPMNWPRGLACSPRSGRIYVASDWSYWPADTLVAVVDCGRQSVRGTIQLPGKPVWPYYDAGRDKVHILIDGLGQDVLTAIDCRSDSTARVIESPRLNWWVYPPIVSAGDGRIITCSGGEMPWVTVIRDTTPIGVEERSLTLEASRITPAATVVRGLLCLPASSVGRGASSVLLDVTGRRVMDLKAGENDVSHLAPGVYFIRWKGSRVQGVEGSSDKVVIAR